MVVVISPNGNTVHSGEERTKQILVGTINGIAVLERQGTGDRYELTGYMLEGKHISSLLNEPTRGGLFAGIHGGGGLFGSLDGGKTWEPKMEGLTAPDVFTLAATERDGRTVLYAGTEPAKLFESKSYGQSWRELPALTEVPGTDTWTFPAPPHLGHVKTIIFDPRDSRTMYVGIEQGALLKSTDAGETWRELDDYSKPEDKAYKDVHRLVIRPSSPNQMYMSGGEGLYYSADAGEKWEHLTPKNWRIGYPDGLLLSPRNDRVMFMSGANRDPGTWRESHFANATVARSEDAGRTWTVLEGALPKGSQANIEAMSLEVRPDGFSIYLGTTSGDVLRTDDEGQSWSQVAAGLAPVSKVGHFRALTTAAA